MTASAIELNCQVDGPRFSDVKLADPTSDEARLLLAECIQMSATDQDGPLDWIAVFTELGKVLVPDKYLGDFVAELLVITNQMFSEGADILAVIDRILMECAGEDDAEEDFRGKKLAKALKDLGMYTRLYWEREDTIEPNSQLENRSSRISFLAEKSHYECASSM